MGGVKPLLYTYIIVPILLASFNITISIDYVSLLMLLRCFKMLFQGIVSRFDIRMVAVIK